MPKDVAKLETCSGCGARGKAHDPLRYEMPDGQGGMELYCDKCYLNFRRFHEEAEDNILAALKGHHLHEVYSLKHLQEALASLGGVTEEAFTLWLERGTVGSLRRRNLPAEE